MRKALAFTTKTPRHKGAELYRFTVVHLFLGGKLPFPPRFAVQLLHG